MGQPPIGGGRGRHESHVEQAKRELTDLLGRLSRRGERRLPAEDRLSRLLGVSRPTVRSALLALEKEGKVHRLHGVGTFVNRHALEVAANLAEDRAFADLLTDLGHRPTVEIVDTAAETLPAALASRLRREPGAPAMVITRVFNASGHPAVLSRDHVPADLLSQPPAALDPERSTFAFVRRWTGRTVRYSVTGVRPASAPPEVARRLRLDDGQPLLLLDHLHVDGADEPVAVTEAYLNDAYIQFSVIRAGVDV